MSSQLLDSVLELTDKALAAYVIAIRLTIGRIGIFDPRIDGNPGLETLIILRRGNLDTVPGLRLYLKSHLPCRILVKKIQHVSGIGLQRIVSVHSSMEAINKIRLFLSP